MKRKKIEGGKGLLDFNFLSCFCVLVEVQGAPAEDAAKDRFVRFEAWLKENGFPQHRLMFATDLPEGNGVVAATDLKVRALFLSFFSSFLFFSSSFSSFGLQCQHFGLQQGELIASIPRKFIMSYERTMTSTKLGQLQTWKKTREPKFVEQYFSYLLCRQIGPGRRAFEIPSQSRAGSACGAGEEGEGLVLSAVPRRAPHLLLHPALLHVPRARCPQGISCSRSLFFLVSRSRYSAHHEPKSD